MARKFSIGRQSDLTLNQELYDLLMALRYINNGPTQPIKDKQTDIPVGAIWNDNSRGLNVLKVKNTDNKWVPAFNDFYHPVNMKDKPLNPVNGQLWLDEDDILKRYDQNTNSWIAVKSVNTTAENVLVDMHNNFINIVPIKDMDDVEGRKTFLVPYSEYGKLFDNGIFIHPTDEKYHTLSDVSVKYDTTSKDEKESWIHVNANKTFKIEKKLLKINKAEDDYKIYGLFDHNTEFYYLDPVSNNGIAMIPYTGKTLTYDYKTFDKGIEIISEKAKAANYIYSVSYVFQDTQKPGKLIRSDFTIGSQSEVQIGQLTKRPMIFLDGLYLEQTKYNYDSASGKIQINDTIINPMDMMAVVFQDQESTGEKEINNITSSGTDTLVGTFTNAVNFKKPLAFVSGVMGTNIVSPEEITFQGNSLLIKNWGLDTIEAPAKVMIVEADNMYVCHGKIDSKIAIRNSQITNNPKDEYLLFIDGLLMSSRELDVSEGEIRISNAKEGQQYVLLKIKDDSNTALSFDTKVMNFTVAINNEDGTMYNECNNALIFADGKMIPMEDSILREALPIKGASGQIVKVKNTMSSSEVYKYYEWNDSTKKWIEIRDFESINAITSMIKGNYSAGSIMLDSKDLKGKKGTFYAYTYSNGVEEPLLKGKQSLIKDKTVYSVNVEHMFSNNEGALTVFTNNLLNYDVSEESSNTGKFIIPTMESVEGLDPYEDGELMYYVERPEKTETVSCQKEVLTAANRTMDFSGGYTTNISMTPGVVTVYVNGVRLNRKDFTIVNENTIVIHKQIVGNQNNYDPENRETWSKYVIYNKKGKVEIDCERDDYILVEVRQDFNIKSQAINVRYPGQRIFYMEDDSIPRSLFSTQDLIKIYIDGVIYTGEYIINRENKSITLLDKELDNVLNIDPIARYFELNPLEHEKYILEHGKPYVANPVISEITFEWR